jgi:hypothetical protein
MDPCFISFFDTVSSSCEVAGSVTACPDAGDAFARAVALTITHESAHASGLVAPENQGTILEQKSPLNGTAPPDPKPYHNQNPPPGLTLMMNAEFTWAQLVEGWCDGQPDPDLVISFLLANSRYLLETYPNRGDLR